MLILLITFIYSHAHLIEIMVKTVYTASKVCRYTFALHKLYLWDSMVIMKVQYIIGPLQGDQYRIDNVLK